MPHAFDDLDRAFQTYGPAAAIDLLVDRLAAQGNFRALLDALLLKARLELGLPLIQTGSLADIPEGLREKYEDRYVEAIRAVGDRFLKAGDITSAWPYFRAIGEKGPIIAALDAYRPAEGEEVGSIIEVAFNQGAAPAKGFELILDHYGACSAITAFEQLPPDEATRIRCAEKLVRHLHGHLAASLRDEIGRHGGPTPPEGASIPSLIDGRAWLFEDDGYHLDISHLAAVVRMSSMLNDPEALALAVELTDYGRNLSERHRYEGEPPFDRLYEDYAVYLRAQLGQDIDAAVAHFRSKLAPVELAEPDDYPGGMGESSLPAQVLVLLLVRLGRLEEAIDVSAEHLTGLAESALICPSLAQLCQRAGRPERLAELARDRGDLVNYAAARLQMPATSS